MYVNFKVFWESSFPIIVGSNGKLPSKQMEGFFVAPCTRFVLTLRVVGKEALHAAFHVLTSSTASCQCQGQQKEREGWMDVKEALRLHKYTARGGGGVGGWTQEVDKPKWVWESVFW